MQVALRVAMHRSQAGELLQISLAVVAGRQSWNCSRFSSQMLKGQRAECWLLRKVVVRVRERRAIVKSQDCKKSKQGRYTICTSVSCNPSLNESMGSCGSKQKKDEETAGPGSSGRAQSSSSKPNQKRSMTTEGRNDQDDIDAVRYLRKQKESPTKVRRSAD